MVSKREIIDSIKKNPDILRRYHVRRIGIFGSFAAGTATEASDVDLLVELTETITIPQYVHLKDDMTKLLKVRADVVPVSGIKPYLRDRIMKEVEWVEGV